MVATETITRMVLGVGLAMAGLEDSVVRATAMATAVQEDLAALALVMADQAVMAVPATVMATAVRKVIDDQVVTALPAVMVLRSVMAHHRRVPGEGPKSRL